MPLKPSRVKNIFIIMVKVINLNLKISTNVYQLTLKIIKQED